MSSKIQNLPTNVKLSTDAYLLTKAQYEVIKEKVDKVYTEILTEPQFAIYNDMEIRQERATEKRLITDSSKMYLSDDEETCKAIYIEADKRLKALGIKPQEMKTEFCPALVANDQLNKAQRALIESVGQMLDQPDNFFDLLLRNYSKFNEFVDLSVKMVLAHPDYTPPKL